MGVATCTECGEEFSYDEMPRRGAICFRCHVQGIRIGFTHTKETFHGMTIREKARQIEEKAAQDGRQIERLPEKVWV